jgi:4-diphosphocytidyl-2C-methyl-D-erythritol kinase
MPPRERHAVPGSAHATHGSVVVTARAKLNLGLAIGPLRPDGFHDLATIFQSVSLADTLEARRARDFRLRVRVEDVALRGGLPAGLAAGVPAGEDNLALRAARLAAEELGLPGGVHLTLIKRIPARAGLGGGSADAAAALAATVALSGRAVGRERMREWASRLGSDVPFMLFGGTALGAGRGERLTRLRPPRGFRALIAVPRWTVSTSRAFAAFDRARYGLTHLCTPLRFAKSSGRMALWPYDAMRLGNTFETLLGGRRRAFEHLRARLREAGLRDVRLTGSGSAVFGVFEPGQSVRVILDRFAGGESLYLVRSTRSGLRISGRPTDRGGDAEARREFGQSRSVEHRMRSAPTGKDPR